MITWKDTIDLIVDTFDSIDQNRLAELLGVSKSTLSKIKAGKQTPPFTTDTVFSKVFDPDNPDSPAKDKPAYHLSVLKEMIICSKYKEIQNSMEDLWDETDYKIFVTKLLDRTKSGVKNTDASISKVSPAAGDSPRIGGTDVPNVRKVSIRASFLPHADKNCCYYCKFWLGDRETIGSYLTSTYGPCLKYGRERRLSSDVACKDFIKQTKFPMERWF